jgi:hypothetical protein
VLTCDEELGVGELRSRIGGAHDREALFGALAQLLDRRTCREGRYRVGHTISSHTARVRYPG